MTSTWKGLGQVMSLTGLLMLTGCKLKQSASESLLANAEKPPLEQTACFSLQGNGSNYSSHVGQLIAVLENNIRVEVATGGSSGALAAASVRGLLTNPSLDKVSLRGPDGKLLTRSQKAAIVMAASRNINESILFVPLLNNPWSMIGALLRSALQMLKADALLGDPDTAFVHVEAMASQASLVVDFFQNTDFSRMLELPSLGQRTEAIGKLWMQVGDYMNVTPHEFINALVTAPSDPAHQNNPRIKEIKRRFFYLFRSDKDNANHNPEKGLADWNTLLERDRHELNKYSPELKTKIFMALLKPIRGFPFLDSVASTFSGPFVLPNPDRLWAVYKGRSYTGKSLTLAPGTIIQTAARTADVKNGKLVERSGFENLYQAYATTPTLMKELWQVRNTFQGKRSFLEYKNGDGHVDIVLPDSQVVLLDERPMSQLIKMTIGEPNAFRRDDMELTSGELNANRLDLHGGVMVSAGGGWFERIGTGPLSNLSACKSADFVMHSTSVGREYIFQRAALRAVVEGHNAWNLANLPIRPDSSLGKIYDKVLKYFDACGSVLGKFGKVGFQFNYDAASVHSGDLGARMSRAFIDNRSALLLAAYQDALAQLKSNQNIKVLNQGMAFGKIDETLVKVNSPERLAEIVERIWKR